MVQDEIRTTGTPNTNVCSAG